MDGAFILIWGQFNETFTSVIYKCSHCFKLVLAGYRFQKVAISMIRFTGFVWTEDLVVGRRILQCRRFGRWTDREFGESKQTSKGEVDP